MLYQSWFYLTDFTFRLIHLTCVKSECYNPSYGTADNFTPAPIVEFLYYGTHIPYFLYFMSYSVGFSLVLPYMILTYIIQILSMSIYLSVYHTNLCISLECWSYVFLDLLSNIHSESHGAVLVDFSDIPPCWDIFGHNPQLSGIFISHLYDQRTHLI